MTQTNIGFDSTVNAVQFAALAGLLGGGPCLGAIGDLPISQVANQRQITLGVNASDAKSRIYGDGVVTVMDAAEALTIPTPANGQWFLVVLNRIWASGVSSFAVRNGPTTATALAANATTPASYPASLLASPGTQSDVPAAWVWASSASTTLVIVGLLLPSARLFPRRGTSAQRDAYAANLSGITTSFAGQVQFQAMFEWYDSANNCKMTYSAPFDATNNPGGTAVRGWYPTEGSLPRVTVPAQSAQTIASGGGAKVLSASTSYERGGYPPSKSAAAEGHAWTVTQAGRYSLGASGTFGASTAGGQELTVRINGTVVFYGGVTFGTASLGEFTASGDMDLSAGDVISFRAYSANAQTFTLQRAWITYLGPA